MITLEKILKQTEADKLYNKMSDFLDRSLDESGMFYKLNSIFIIIEERGVGFKNENFLWSGCGLKTLKPCFVKGLHSFRIGGEDFTNIETKYDYKVIIKSIFKKFEGNMKTVSYMTEECVDGGFAYIYSDLKGSKPILDKLFFNQKYLNSIQTYNK